MRGINAYALLLYKSKMKIFSYNKLVINLYYWLYKNVIIIVKPV